jgi:hypothetical protein
MCQKLKRQNNANYRAGSRRVCVGLLHAGDLGFSSGGFAHDIGLYQRG